MIIKIHVYFQMNGNRTLTRNLTEYCVGRNIKAKKLNLQKTVKKK